MVEKEKNWVMRIFENTDSALLIYFLLTFSLAAFIIILVLSPYLIQSENFFFVGIASLTYKLMAEANVCHQLPERTHALGGILMPVCVRDFAIFFGGFLGLILSFFRMPRLFSSKWFLLFATAPIAIDGVSQTILRLRESSDIARFVTGIIFGFAFAHFLGKKILEERGSSRLGRNAKVAAAILLIFLLFFSLFASGVGFLYKTRSHAIETAGETSTIKNPPFIKAFYLPPKSIYSVPLDPFLKNYDDAILNDIVNLEERPSFGLWVVVILEEKPLYEKKYVFLSGGKGEYFYIDAFSGKIVQKNVHT